MTQLPKDYDKFSVMQKVEIFKAVLSATDGMDLKKILWLQSLNAEVSPMNLRIFILLGVVRT
jgi:hypothetical protein